MPSCSCTRSSCGRTLCAAQGALNWLLCSVCAAVVSVGLGLAMWEQKARRGAVPGLRRLHLRCGSDAQPGDRLAYADVGHLRQPDASVRPVVDVAGRLWRHGGPHSRAPVRAVHVRPVRGPAAGAGEPRAAGVALGGPDHAVPKDSYYLVRILEFVLMWVLIVYNQDRHLPGAGGQAGEGAHRLQGCRSSARWGCTWSCPSSGASPAATSSRGTLSIGATTRRRATPISGTPTPRPMKRGACWIGWTTRTSRRSEGFPGRPAPRLSNASFHDFGHPDPRRPPIHARAASISHA
ncbi:unnamed protein product [Prorocentrum cordatum]|uniref:Uncharacterized protein n=1 Tax=Prorocentrum cordatum TaxID=2364126 RepID=A0ABN9VVM4_9DINO|nr:unnamed protein product [Polarella glacialis]